MRRNILSGQSRPNTGWKQPHSDISHDNDKKRKKKKIPMVDSFMWPFAVSFESVEYRKKIVIFIPVDSTTQVI